MIRSKEPSEGLVREKFCACSYKVERNFKSLIDPTVTLSKTTGLRCPLCGDVGQEIPHGCTRVCQCGNRMTVHGNALDCEVSMDTLLKHRNPFDRIAEDMVTVEVRDPIPVEPEDHGAAIVPREPTLPIAVMELLPLNPRKGPHNMIKDLAIVGGLLLAALTCFAFAFCDFNPLQTTFDDMSEREKELVRQCQGETSMDFDGCVETVDRDGRKTW